MSRTSEESLEGLIALIADLTIWDVNVESGLLTGRLLHKTEVKGNTIGFRNIFIASIALALATYSRLGWPVVKINGTNCTCLGGTW
jgi:predicted nucleic acid-binding protein